MAHTKLFWISQCSIAFGLLLGTGCAKDDDTGDDNADDTTGSEGDDDGSTVSMTSNASMTASMTSTDPSADDSGTMTMSDSGSDDVSTFEDSGTTDTPMPMPNGSSCGDDADCESMHCFVSPIGNICGECEVDADCADTTMGGCSIPNPLSDPPTGSTCNMGEHGAGCMTSDICMDPYICVEILNVPGLLMASTCSECESDKDCTDTLCSPSYDVANLAGSKDCVEPGSVPNGEGCDFAGTGDDACLSGFCAIADVMMLLQLGVCSECEEDMDCGMDMTCEVPTVDLMEGLVAGTCVPA
jgi:hypothetical protein